jgi:hypothetical protein
MERLSIGIDDGDDDGNGDGGEEFGLDCHDLSLENVFVDEDDHSKIVRLANSLNLITVVILTLLRPASLTGSRRRSDHCGPPSLVPPVQSLHIRFVPRRREQTCVSRSRLCSTTQRVATIRRR